MRIVAFSDSHNKHRKLNVPDGDILIFGGDATESGTFHEMLDFILWFKSLPHEHKFFVAGNHDFIAEGGDPRFNSLLDEINYLQNDSIEREGLLIHGSPMTPTYGRWAFMRDRGPELNRYWEMIPDTDLDILVVHGPPQGILDTVMQRQYGWAIGQVGDEGLRDRIMEVKPKLFLCGHIHESQGWHRDEHTLYVNTSIMNLQYEPVYTPVVIDFNEADRTFHLIHDGRA